MGKLVNLFYTQSQTSSFVRPGYTYCKQISLEGNVCLSNLQICLIVLLEALTFRHLGYVGQAVD